MTRRRRPFEGRAKLPTWIISFTDMVTLLLAFFVMLQALAHEQRPDLFFQGQGAYRRAIASFGIPYLMDGRRSTPEREWIVPLHPVEENPDDFTRKRILDMEVDRLREVFAQLQQEFETQTGPIGEKPLDIRPMSIAFEPGTMRLSTDDLAELERVASDLRANLGSRSVRVYVIGLAGDQPAGPRQWQVSTDRAARVEAALRPRLAPQLHRGQWQLQSIGAGASPYWTRLFDAGSSRAKIVLAVMEEV